MNSHRNSIDEMNPYKDKILRIIPKQTYEYLNGKINEDFVNKSNIQLVFSYLYEKGACRIDKITSFEMAGKEENANLVGNKIINSHLFLRELTFRLGKLPNLELKVFFFKFLLIFYLKSYFNLNKHKK